MIRYRPPGHVRSPHILISFGDLAHVLDVDVCSLRTRNSLVFCNDDLRQQKLRIPPPRIIHTAPASAATNPGGADYGRSSSAPKSVNERTPGRYVSFQINSNVPSQGLTVAASGLNESCGGRYNRTPPYHPTRGSCVPIPSSTKITIFDLICASFQAFITGAALCTSVEYCPRGDF